MIFDDEKYALCLSLANAKRRTTQMYGSFLEKDNKIFGLGRNTSVKIEGPTRLFRQGWSNHAEGESINNALMNMDIVKGSTLYVAGCFTDGQLLIYDKTPEFTCTKCVNLFSKYELHSIKVPSLSGWKEMTIEDAINSAQKFKAEGKGSVEAKRLQVTIPGYNISQMKKLFPVSFNTLSFPYISTSFLL